jgi:ribonuclease HI
MDRYQIVFDGGSKGNPGPAYGSFFIQPWTDDKGVIERLSFGEGTNNEAEYLSLISSVRYLLAFLAGKGVAPAAVALEVHGDSQLIMRQLKKEWKAKDSRMRALRDEALQLLYRFKSYELNEQPRAKIVKRLGH